MTDKDVAAIAALPGVQDVIPFYQRRLTLNYVTTTLSVTVYGMVSEQA